MSRFTFTSAGESHGPQLTILVQGIPAGLRLDRERINNDLRRRQHGYGRGGRMKIESDEAEITAGGRRLFATPAPLPVPAGAAGAALEVVVRRALEPE